MESERRRRALRHPFAVLVLAPVIIVVIGAVPLLGPGVPPLSRSRALVGLAVLAVLLAVAGLGTFLVLTRARVERLDAEREGLMRLTRVVAPVLLPGGGAALAFLLDYANVAEQRALPPSVVTAVALAVLFAVGGIALLVSRGR